MWLDIQIFGFRGLWSPYFLSFIIILGILYYLITGPLRFNYGVEEKPTVKQQIYFYTGLLLLYIVKGSPIDLLAHIILTAHMIQMAVYLLLFPVLMIKGIPVWIWKKIIETPVIKKIFKLFSKPLIPLLLFNLLFSLYHIPAVFDFSKSSRPAHVSISLVLLFAAFMMWWVIITPIKEQNKLKPLLKIVYMGANGALITPACVLIIFAGEPAFQAYSSDGAWIQAMSLCVPKDVLKGLAGSLSGAEMFSPMSTIGDQQLGGIIMKVLTEIVYGTTIGRIFFQWFKPSKDSIDPLPEPSTPELQ